MGQFFTEPNMLVTIPSVDVLQMWTIVGKYFTRGINYF